ncbi:MAG: class I SAM-dependent methyltransferase [Ilumatobacteraceae bacterium]
MAKGGRPTVAATVGSLADAMFGGQLSVRVEFWDASALGPPVPPAPGTLQVRRPDALRRLMWRPGELGLASAYVAGDLDVDGDIFEVLAALLPVTSRGMRLGWSSLPAGLRTALRLGLVRRPLPAPPEEARPRGGLHSLRRDASVISHHYDVGNDFYRLILGPSMTYSCARFADGSVDLAAAQVSKHELICRKLGVDGRPGVRLLDVGCGWGSMAIHAALHHDVTVVGITISRAQADLARKRVAEAGVADRVGIRLQDYRELGGERFDAISSIGMSEHVGAERLADYYGVLRNALAPQGRLLNHAISSVGGLRIGSDTFIGRYVFPDGELIDVGDSVLAMERAGFQVRDVESLREHYATTLRAWVANLDARWDEAVDLVGIGRTRVWRLYMAASAVNFEAGRFDIHQVLGVVPDEEGASGMPATRRAWDATPAGPAA